MISTQVALAGKQVAKLETGQSFGESGLDPAGNKRRTASIISMGARAPMEMIDAVRRLFPAGSRPLSPKLWPVSSFATCLPASATCVEINRWYGGSPPNFRTL